MTEAEIFVKLHNKAMDNEIPYPMPYFKPEWPRNVRDDFRREVFEAKGITKAEEKRRAMSTTDTTFNQYIEAVSPKVECDRCKKALVAIGYAKIEIENVVLDSDGLLIVADPDEAGLTPMLIKYGEPCICLTCDMKEQEGERDNPV